LLHFSCSLLIGRGRLFKADNVKKIGILYHPKVPATHKKAREIETLLRKRGLSVWTCSAWEKEEACGLMAGTDLLITVGGDGTILRAIQVTMTGTVPILSVNLGKLGFLTELSAEESLRKLPGILEKGGYIDERAMLRAEVATGARRKEVFHALNDIVVARGEIARLTRIAVDIDSQPLATYRADAVIVSTATGSTGYALAAHGPVLHPRCQDLLLAPVAPHLSLAYPLVLPPDAVITLRPETYLTAVLSVDGHINLPLADGVAVTVSRSPHVARFLRVRPGTSFYRSLEKKLKGK
jgi:NAD+ kinase